MTCGGKGSKAFALIWSTWCFIASSLCFLSLKWLIHDHFHKCHSQIDANVWGYSQFTLTLIATVVDIWYSQMHRSMSVQEFTLPHLCKHHSIILPKMTYNPRVFEAKIFILYTQKNTINRPQRLPIEDIAEILTITSLHEKVSHGSANILFNSTVLEESSKQAETGNAIQPGQGQIPLL